MVETKPTGLEKPAGAVPAADEPVIHVIPEKFYGAGLKMKVKDAPPSVPPSVPPPGVPAIPAPAKPKKSRLPLFVAIGVVLLLLVGGVVYFLTRPPATTPIVNVNTTPAPRCGDAKCDAPDETSANCSSDCGAPAPVCGDSKCEAPDETSANCSADCGAPAPVCGDNKCEAPTETVEECPADCRPPEPEPGVDNDSDGLSDQEEREVFGTDPASPNTDKDSFVDLNEALNLFDPARPAPSMLRDSPTFAVYSNVADNYALIRPAAWTAKAGSEGSGEVMFTAPSGEFIVVLTEEKPLAQSLMDWYLAQSPGFTSSQVEPYKTRNGFDAILSPDRQTAYVDFGDHVIVVSYNLGSQLNVQYRVTFQVMVQSLEKK